jgi:hypothetical protein
MGLSHSPQIVTDGLVFYYDMGNALKSWKGKPTTNLADVGLNGMSGVSLSFLGIENGWKKYSMSGTFTGGTYPYTLNITNVSFTGGVTYSSSCFIRTNVENKFNYFGTGMNYVNVPMNKGGTSIGVRQADSSFYCGRSNFEYTSTTTQTGYILSNPINNTTFSAGTDFVWIKNGQVELGEFSTPFAGDAGTRSNTQAVLDLTNNNTVTATSLTYNTDNTFSFNGSSNYIDVTNNLGVLSNYTISFWARRDAENRMPVAARVGTPFYWYGDNSWRYTHGGVGGEYYYSKPTSIPLGTWGHYCVVYNGANVSIYRQGVFQGSQNTTGTADWSGGMRIGFWAGGAGYYWQGRIDAVSMYNRALTAAEIQQNFSALRGRYGL